EFLKQPKLLGSWLHGVATRTALKARGQKARRRQVEKRVAVRVALDQPDDLLWRDLRPVLDEAIAGLPDCYRVPFVLHHLDGVTVADVASRLGRPQGTVAAQLARAKERMRTRLLRRGITLSAGSLTLLLSRGMASASVSAPLLVSTIQSVTVAA